MMLNLASLPLGLVPLQGASWLPHWLTPVWVLGIGLAAGLVGAALLFALYAVLSRIPGLGTLADDRRRGHAVSAVLAAVVTAGLAWVVLPRIDDPNRVYVLTPLALVGAIVGWGTVFGMWRRTIAELGEIVQERVLSYFLIVFGSLAGIALAISFFAADKREILASVPQVFTAGERVERFVIDAAPTDLPSPDQAPFQRVDLDYDAATLSEIEVSTTRTVLIADAPTPEEFRMSPQRLEADETAQWTRAAGGTEIPLPPDPSDGVYVQNREIDPATVTVRLVTRPAVPEASTIPITASLVMLLVLGYVALRQAAPRLSAVALSTAKSEIAQPLFPLLLALGAVAIILFIFVPFNTLGEDIKVLKDSGMTLIMVFGIVLAVWAAGTGVSEEIEGRTALTVLSKPITRRSFLVGKFLGIFWVVLLLFVMLGLLLLITTAYKPLYDARETAAEQPLWQICHLEMVTTVPGLTLLFMETVLIAGISVAIATRLPMLANFVICFTVYVLGNLTAPIVRSSVGDFEIVSFVGRLIAVVVPNLNSFNIQAAVDAGNPIPSLYLAAALTYLACFAVVVLMIALLLFEDRDLA